MKIAVLTAGGVAPGMKLADGDAGTMVGVMGEETRRVPLDEVVGEERPLDPDMYELARVLAGMSA